MLPGPQILSTLGMDSVPKARAATAWAPPTEKIRSIPAMSAATSVIGETAPSDCGGVAKMTSLTPATFAGIAVIRSEEGRGAVKPGTCTPTRLIGRTSQPRPFSVLSLRIVSLCLV